MRIGITGASGLVGSALAKHLGASGHAVVPFVRRPPMPGEIEWDPARGVISAADLADLDAVVNLAGAGIGDRRWTPEYKQTILASRVDGTALLASTMATAGGPGVLLNASAIGYYGDTDAPVDEGSEPGHDFLAQVAVAWEAATATAEQAGIRVVHMRTGIVLSGQGGALKRMLPLFKLALGGRFGSGKQWMSWISIDDEVAAIEHLLTSPRSGAVNLVAPEPVRNAEFAKTLGRVLGRPAVMPVPAFGPRLLLGRERADCLLFSGQRVQPAALLEDGFEYRHRRLEPALSAVLSPA